MTSLMAQEIILISLKKNPYFPLGNIILLGKSLHLATK